MRVLVCGSRHYIGTKPYFHVYEVLDKVSRFTNVKLHKEPMITTIIEGGALGVDTIARQYAIDYEIPFITFPADWEKYGQAAGPIRNKQMLEEGKPDMVIAFLAPNSRGTKNMIEQAREANIPIKVINI